MADDPEHQQQQSSSGYWSGKNKIPTVGQFIQNLDKDKKARDAELDQQAKAQAQQQGLGGSDVRAHQNEVKKPSSSQKQVTDPVTGKEVTIEDVNKDFMERVENPMLSVPNANLGKDTPVKTDASQKNPEYAHNQDITSPPDPVEPGSTSDVPIHGEKTNILFHPTPSTSYEPTLARLEQRGLYLVVGVFVGIILLGRAFGGRYIGVIPLAMCVSSGIWLWVKEVERSMREVEWRRCSSLSDLHNGCSRLMSFFARRIRKGTRPDCYRESSSRECRMDEHTACRCLGTPPLSKGLRRAMWL
jgi:Ca2+-dependent lipid-binding protein